MGIRKARVEDIPSISDLLQEILTVHHEVRPDLFKKEGQKFSSKELEILLENPQRPIFVYEEDGQILGHLFCHILQQEGPVLEPITSLFIDDLCVSSSARGRGIGQSLYEFAEDFARDLGCYNLTLDVWDSNVAAKRFYEEQGLISQKTRMERIL